MKKITLFATLLFMYQLTIAQYENFDLAKYKLPDMKRQTLEFRLNSSGSDYKSRVEISPAYGADTILENRSNLNANFSVDYNYYRNSEIWQVVGTSYASFNTKHDKRDVSSYYYPESSGIVYSVGSDFNIKYFLSPKWFLNASPGFSYSESHIKEESEKTTSNYFYANVAIGGGYGRIERVEDFRQAILLLKDLEKREVIKRSLSEEELLELAAKISEIKKERFFDSRKHTEAELRTIDIFLREKNVIQEPGINYFSGLYDMWLYGSLQIRESGRQLLFTIRPNYSARRYGTEDDPAPKITGLQYLLNYSLRKPISLKWQTDYNIGVSHSHSNRNYEALWTDFEQSYSHAFIEGLFGFYPNTRSNYILKTRISIDNSSGDKILDKDSYLATVYLGASSYYYISERLRLTFDVSYDIQKSLFESKYGTGRIGDFNYQLFLSYAIF